MIIQTGKSEIDILKCREVVFELRPHLEQQNFLATIQEMISEGYQFAFIQEEGKAVSFIGYRYLQYLYNGKHIYIDDLSTLPDFRGKGYAAKLLQHVEEIAISKGYGVVTLDSGHQRTDAHRLYLNKGFNIVALHFSKKIK